MVEFHAAFAPSFWNGFDCLNERTHCTGTVVRKTMKKTEVASTTVKSTESTQKEAGKILDDVDEQQLLEVDVDNHKDFLESENVTVTVTTEAEYVITTQSENININGCPVESIAQEIEEYPVEQVVHNDDEDEEDSSLEEEIQIEEKKSVPPQAAPQAQPRKALGEIQISSTTSNTINNSSSNISSIDKSECNVSFAQLKHNYVQIATNGCHQSNNSSRTNIKSRECLPSINIEALRNTYNSRSSESVNTSPNKTPVDDIIPVNINALRESFTRQQSIHAVREPSPVEEVKLSVDKKKVQSQFSKDEGENLCNRCEKKVYPAERVRAEKSVYHKTCFRCKECGKTLSAETYHSHESELYCANHFKQLFQPKANFENDSGPQAEIDPFFEGNDNVDDAKQRKHEMIIRENEPMQLSPDVVRCDTRSNLEDLENLNLNLGSLKSRFESAGQEDEKKPKSVADRSALSRSASVLKRLEKYQSVVSGEAKADSSDEEDDGMTTIDLSKKIEVCREMSQLKKAWESGNLKEERVVVKDELSGLRKRICHGRSESMRSNYEKAVEEANKITSSCIDDAPIMNNLASSLKKRFENGEVIKEQEDEKLEQLKNEKEEEFSVFQETGIAHQAKNMFKQMDKEISTIRQAQPLSPAPKTSEPRWKTPTSDTRNVEIVKCSDPNSKEDIEVETVALSQRYKFFENYKEPTSAKKEFKMTPPRDLGEKENSPGPVAERDPDVVVGSTVVDDIPKVDTATKMRHMFQQMCESSQGEEKVKAGPKPMKRITPPRETFEGNVVENTPIVDPDVVRCSYKVDDNMAEVVEADKAKSMRARFENWTDVEKRKNSVNLDDDCLPVDNITKNMKAMFEQTAKQQVDVGTEKTAKGKVNRFVYASNSELCHICQGKVFPMERREASGLVMHQKCFKCTHCNINLRLDGYSQTGGKLYCEAHYQQLFKVKGNYDEGFGRERWSRTPSPAARTNQNGSNGESLNIANNQPVTA